MRLKPKLWIGLVIALAVTMALIWRAPETRRSGTSGGERAGTSQALPLLLTNAIAQSSPNKAPGTPFTIATTNAPNAPFTNALAYRVSNTTQPLDEFMRSDRAVVLRHALIDTTRGLPVIPEHLRSKGDPGAYIVQSRGAITEEFRAALRAAGAEIVSYVPNNAYLVRASGGVARALRSGPFAQAVLPVEPYYKLDARLLALAVNKDLSPYGVLTVVGYPNSGNAAREALEKSGAEVVGEPEPSAFGPILTVKVGADKLADVAQLSDVQMMAVRYEKRLMNDLTRVILKVSRTSTNATPPAASSTQYGLPTATSFLTGAGIHVAVADSGVDEAHPDLTGRVFWGGLPDVDGHGTHVIGTLLGNGSQSSTVPFGAASGSSRDANFYGMAPLATAFVQDYQVGDAILQRNTALTNALISNNSWGRPGDNEYDIYAASYDAAVRDSLPGVTGEQQVAYVFAAGNEGGGGPTGINGRPGSVVSPATGKNVITVGASDLPRYITNEVVRACETGECETNRQWYAMTDTNNQVSPYSSRGNVGVGIEGPGGRYKPDVVAPGSMLVSARSQYYVDPLGSTNTFPFQYNGQTVGFNQTNLYPITIPANAISLVITAVPNAFSPSNMILQIGAEMDAPPGAGSMYGTGALYVDPNTAPVALRAGTLFYTVANTTHSNTVNFDLLLLLTVTNDNGNYDQVLAQLNAPLAPYYRYEAGTSMAAPAVSGMLALMQEYFTNQFQLRPSPALLKAMLINGARSLSAAYDLQPGPLVNHQGWGLANLSNSLPSGIAKDGPTGPLRFYDQSLTNSLVTGDTETYTVTVPDTAKSYPLRITLVWSDPPGNPITGVKLVNDLNLTVTAGVTNQLGQGTNTNSVSSSLLWVGNNFAPGSDFTSSFIESSTDTNATVVSNLVDVVEQTRDYVNNVENVYIRPPLASSYTVTVKAHRVNVNAVNSHSNNVVQDYALVIASGNVAAGNNVDLAVAGPSQTPDSGVRFSGIPRSTNSNRGSLLNQRVGANSPLIVSTNGATNQWCFYTYTNSPGADYTNVVILTFLAPNLSLPRNRDADIDLFVARGPSALNLTNLDNGVIAASTRSVGRGGTEYVYFTDAQPSEVFYIGVKSEDQQAANFSLYAESRNTPFNSRSSNNIIASAIGPIPIPDGTPDQPDGVTNMFVFVLDPRDIQTTIQRVYVTNAIYHENGGDLLGILDRPGGTNQVVLNNHRPWNGLDVTVYDDSGQGDLGDENDVPPVMEPDGPGRLRDFAGEQAGPIWNFTVSDNALFQTGYVQEVTLVIEPTSTNTTDPNILVDRQFCIQPGRWVYVPVNIGFDVYNMETCVSEFQGGGAEPVQVYIRQGNFPDFGAYDYRFDRLPPGDPCFDVGLGDNPPLFPGRWYIGLYNPPGNAQLCLRLRVTVSRTVIPAPYSIYYSTDTPITLLDDATTNSSIFISQTGRIADLRVGIRVAHERASDLAFHIVSPNGTRVLLMENRGRTNSAGIGSDLNPPVVTTNVVRRILNDGFEDTDTNVAAYCSGNGWPVGSIFSGWTVVSGNVDVIHDAPCQLGLKTPAHTGINAVDLNGLVAGAISTNLVTTIGKTYRLTYAYAKHPERVQTVAEVDCGPLTVSFSDNRPYNTYESLTWLQTSIVFRAASPSTPVQFRSISPAGNAGMYIDTIRLDELEVVTNSFLYTTFTENTNLTLTPIKFGQPPFTNSPNPQSSLVLDDGFEFLSTNLVGSAQLGIAPPTVVSGWQVEAGTVDIHSGVYNPPHTGIYSLDSSGYNPGRVSTNIFTEPGADYLLTFAYLKNDATNILFAEADVSLQGASPLATLTIHATNGFEWSVTSLVFTADSPVTKLTLDSLTAGDGGVVFDSFTIRRLSPSLALDAAYFLPEEPLTPLFGQQSRGLWTLEVWDSRLGAVVSNGTLLSWRLEIAYPPFNPPLFPLTNGVAHSNLVAGDGTVYFSVPVTCPIGVITNYLQNLDGNGGLDLTFNQFTLPTNGPNDVLILDDVITSASTNLIIGAPPLAVATRYYLAVRNSDPTQTNRFILRMDEVCGTNNATAIDTNAVCRTITPTTREYFTFNFAPNMTALRIETYGADGNVDLYARPGLTPPIAGVVGLASSNAGTANEFIQSSTNTGPYYNTPGAWTIMVENTNDVPVSYCLKVTEIDGAQIRRIVLGTAVNDIVEPGATTYFVVNVDAEYCNLFFNTGGSHIPALDLWLFAEFGGLPPLIGSDYFAAGMPAQVTTGPVFGRIGDWYLAVENTNAVPVEYSLNASGGGLCPPLSPVIRASASSYSASGFRLEWQASVSDRYQVQYTETLSPANWQTITNIITSTDGRFEFLDTGATNHAQRFYQLLRVP